MAKCKYCGTKHLEWGLAHFEPDTGRWVRTLIPSGRRTRNALSNTWRLYNLYGQLHICLDYYINRHDPDHVLWQPRASYENLSIQSISPIDLYRSRLRGALRPATLFSDEEAPTRQLAAWVNEEFGVFEFPPSAYDAFHVFSDEH